MSFKKTNTLEKRMAESKKILDKYPDRIPIIVEKGDGKNLPEIDKKKYLVPSDLTMGQFLYVIRKRIKLEPTKGLYIFIDNILPATSQTVGNIYNEKKDPDGFLYIVYQSENTFG